MQATRRRTAHAMASKPQLDEATYKRLSDADARVETVSRLKKALRLPREEAAKKTAEAAQDYLKHRLGMDIPVYTASLEQASTARFFTKFLQRRMASKKSVSYADIVQGISERELGEEWTKAQEEAKNGAGEGMYLKRLGDWGEVEKALQARGFGDYAKRFTHLRESIQGFAQSRGLDPQQDEGFAFLSIGEKTSMKKFFEVALHEGVHIWDYRLTRQNPSSIPGVGQVTSKMELNQRLHNNPSIKAQYMDELDPKRLQGILERLKRSERIDDGFISRLRDNDRMNLPLSNQTLTGEGLASIMSRQMMGELGLNWALDYKQGNPKYYLGMQMWAEVLESGASIERSVERLLSPYRSVGGEPAVTGVVELFEQTTQERGPAV